MRSIEDLQKELISVSQQFPLNINRIVELTNEISKIDPDYVRFSTDAGIINRLGIELVAKAETAVAELIKNAYDADSNTVNVIFEDTDNPGGTLIIEDDGLGMSREQLIEGFMRLSSSEKISSPNSPKYHRLRAGRKGIGRFAVQRLGALLTIITQTKESSSALKLTIDWGLFSSGKDLSSITSKIEYVKKEKVEGTTLIIGSLREAWQNDSITKVYRHVSDLLQPYPLEYNDISEEDENNFQKITDRGFKVKLMITRDSLTSVVADEQTMVFSQALAVIEGYVDSAGNGTWNVKSTKIPNLKKTENKIYRKGNKTDSSQYHFLRNVNLKVYYFIWERGLVSSSLLKSLKELAQEKGGIRVYRNGFRVMPYGQKNNDWLQLDESYSKRNFLPAHGNSNFFGFVQITDLEGRVFEETSSREGLLENAAFNELVEFCYGVLTGAILRIAEARGKKQFRSQPGWEPEIDPSKATKQAADRIKKATAQVNSLLQSAAKANYADATMIVQVMRSLEQASDEIQESTRIQERQRQELLEELGMLRVLGSLGLFIGEFTHEVRQTLIAANINARLLAESLEETEKREMAQDLLANLLSFKTYASYFDKAISSNAKRVLDEQNLRHVIREFIKTVLPSAQKKGISMDASFNDTDILTPAMHKSEWSSILLNFYTNAQKAIYKAQVKGRILITAGVEEDKIFLNFSDNGIGIQEGDKDRIFNAFYTTSSAVDGKYVDELQGTGLGLKIVRDIVNSYGGDVYVTSPEPNYSTTIRIEFSR